MKIESFKFVKEEGVEKEDLPVIRTIAGSVNPFGEQVYEALSNKLTISENMQQEIRSIDVIVDASGIPTTSVVFKNKFVYLKVKGIQVIRAENVTNPNAFVSGAPFVSFTQNNDLITIRHISGLIANNRYLLSFVTIIN